MTGADSGFRPGGSRLLGTKMLSFKNKEWYKICARRDKPPKIRNNTFKNRRKPLRIGKKPLRIGKKPLRIGTKPKN